MEDSIVYMIMIEAIVLIVFSLIIGNIGSKRTIGFLTAFLLSLFLTPIVGLLFVFSSDKKSYVDYSDEESEGVSDGVNEGVNDVGYSDVGYEKENDVGYSDVGYKKNNDFGYENNNVGFTGKRVIKNVISKTPVRKNLKSKLTFLIHKLKMNYKEGKCKDFS